MTTKLPKLTLLAKNKDPRELPTYTVAEASHYLTIPAATVSSWVFGTSHFKNVIDLPVKDVRLLSFLNLAEIHVLRALRVHHGVKLPAIRKALEFVGAKYGWKRPLVRQEFRTDGVGLFIDHYGKLVEASADGQMAMREVLEAHLARLDWENKVVARLYPFTRQGAAEAPKTVFIDPRFSFGRPILTKSHIATAVIAERYKAGESIEELAADYDCSPLEIEEGVRCELRLAAAA
jgi:uncharacterized protein (DUF433 family)